MDAEHRDGWGIIGTPLHFDAKNEFKVSAPNKIAPTPGVYVKLRERTVFREERNLLDNAALFAARHDNLYTQRSGRRSYRPEDFMDKEDRIDLRVRGMISRGKARTLEQSVSSSNGTALSFLAASVDLPEMTPKPSLNSIEYRELQNADALRTQKAVHAHSERQPHSGYKVFQLFAQSVFQGKRTGLGYCVTGKVKERGGLNEEGRPEQVSFNKSLERTNPGTIIAHESDEDYMDQLANGGYKDLDAATKRMSQKLQEDRIVLRQVKRVQKRTAGDVSGGDDKDVIFQSFVECQDIEKGKSEWTDYDVPTTFAANPCHSFQTDRMRTKREPLPASLQKEYNMLLFAYKESRKEETDAVRASIAIAMEQQEAKLQRIREHVLEDIGARFTQAEAHRKQQAHTGKHSFRELNSQCEDKSGRHPKPGETNRRSQHWKPENLLLKRLGIERAKDVIVSPSHEPKPPRSRTLLFPDKDEEFRIHSITGADGGRIGIRRDWCYAEDEDALYSVGNETEVHLSDARGKRPSQELVQAIFAKPQRDGANRASYGEASKDAILGIGSMSKNERRGFHKTRAADFF